MPDLSRRNLIKSALITAGGLATHAFARTAGAVYAYVGCYTTAARQARGDGIHVYKMDPETGAWTHLQHVGDLVNPSFLVLSRDQRFLYSVHGDETYASSFSIDKNTGFLTPLNKAATGGRNGVHQAFDPSGKFMVMANYSTGTVAVLPVQPDGKLQDQIQLVELPGKPGPHRVEQISSHPHNIVFDPSGKFVLVPDKGLDRVFIFRFDSASGKLTPTEQGSVASRPGYAPRHMAFHPTLPVVWVLNELGSAITSYRWDPQHGALQPLQILPTLPGDFTGVSTAAEIAVLSNGRYVYCSNRGHDSIAMYASDPSTGLLKSTGWVLTQGKSPRFITLSSNQHFLYAANEQGDTIVPFRVNASTGHLTPAGQGIQNASPVAIAFLTNGTA